MSLSTSSICEFYLWLRLDVSPSQFAQRTARSHIFLCKSFIIKVAAPIMPIHITAGHRSALQDCVPAARRDKSKDVARGLEESQFTSKPAKDLHRHRGQESCTIIIIHLWATTNAYRITMMMKKSKSGPKAGTICFRKWKNCLGWTPPFCVSIRGLLQTARVLTSIII